MIVWGGTANASAFFNDGARYVPATDSWLTMNSGSAPSGRGQQLAVWSGNVMVIWGGLNGSTAQNTGSRYDPVGDTWSVISATGAPTARYGSAVIWSGTEMILWSGITSVSVYPTTGGRYNPVTDFGRPPRPLRRWPGRDARRCVDGNRDDHLGRRGEHHLPQRWGSLQSHPEHVDAIARERGTKHSPRSCHRLDRDGNDRLRRIGDGPDLPERFGPVFPGG